MASYEGDAEVLDAREAASYLKLNEQTLRRLARERKVPAFKVGGSWRFRRSSLDRWADTQAESGPDIFILIVDDEPEILSLLRREFEFNGYKIETAANGVHALRCLERSLPALIILDLKMPDIDGVEILQAIRERSSTLPVIILTAYPESELMARALQHSPITLFAKPVEANKVVQAVKAILPA